jgi:hypothetical protein
MLHALFSTRYLQQLLREGKLANEYTHIYSILLYLVAFPCLILLLFDSYSHKLLEIDISPSELYGIACVGVIAWFLISQFFLWYFTTIFNYQEQRYLYSAIKSICRFYHALLLVCIIPIAWYTRTPELVFFVYFPFLLIILFAFFIRFLENINGASRIQFFIYFCSLEILPCLLLAKFLIISL